MIDKNKIAKAARKCLAAFRKANPDGYSSSIIDIESNDSYKNEMNGIYSTSVCEETIDEAPMAYKPTEEIVELIKPTVDVIDVIKPIYNFKAKL